MAVLKTRATDASVEEFLAAIPDDGRRADARAVCELLTRITGEPAVMWGDAIVGFGQQHLRYESGRELDWFVIGFSPRKANTTIYLSDGCDKYAELLERLGKHKAKGSCLHLNHLADANEEVLAEILTKSVEHVRASNA